MNFDLIEEERKRQYSCINLIASENYVSDDVLKAIGSILTNKYAEGSVGNRYYAGCCVVDKIEKNAIELAKKLFNAKYVNVQPHSGSQANMAIYNAFLNFGDKILSLGLNCGGHLTHGSAINFSGQFYRNIHYGVDKKTELVDLNIVEDFALKEKPRIIVCGASAYSHDWNYKGFREISDRIGALLVCDMAHTAGIIACNKLNNPLKFCHVVTSSTQKTLRGPRGGIILMNEDFEDTFSIIEKKRGTMMSEIIDRVVFPGIQGGPFMNIIAGKAIAFKEAMSDNFKVYIDQVLKNSSKLATLFIENGYRVVSNGTENHMFLVDLRNKKINGIEAEKTLESVGIITNRNQIPYDEKNALVCSGIRIGTPAITTLGFKEDDMEIVFEYIDCALKNVGNYGVLKKLKYEISHRFFAKEVN